MHILGEDMRRDSSNVVDLLVFSLRQIGLRFSVHGICNGSHCAVDGSYVALEIRGLCNLNLHPVTHLECKNETQKGVYVSSPYFFFFFFF